MEGGSDFQRKKDLDRELNDYLSAVNRRRPSMSFFSSKEPQDSNFETYGEKGESVFDSIAKAISGLLKPKKENKEEELVPELNEHGNIVKEQKEAEPTAETKEFDEHAQESKEGFWKKFKNLFFSPVPSEEVTQESTVEEVSSESEDMKLLANSVKNMLKMLPSEEIQKLKATEDFANFKKILEKNKIIKQ